MRVRVADIKVNISRRVNMTWPEDYIAIRIVPHLCPHSDLKLDQSWNSSAQHLYLMRAFKFATGTASNIMRSVLGLPWRLEHVMAPSKLASGLRVRTTLSRPGSGRNFSGIESQVFRPIITCQMKVLAKIVRWNDKHRSFKKKEWQYRVLTALSPCRWRDFLEILHVTW